MSQERLQQSQSPGGPHHFLTQCVGDWEGMARTWFEPDKVADESPISGTIRSVLDGRFVVHEYTSSLGGKPLTGMATLGYHLDGPQFTMAWVDSFHMGSDIMALQGEAGVSDRFSVLGSYYTGEQSPRWGWRVDLERTGPDALVITHFNIQPGEAAQKAIEIQYRRRG
ncbi:DUF1579 domain-containing protein [Corallococcus llansteffanensis]|uniref:DUF1579 domain-containing protein n=1 Tax=Corallococcus llansteffanensis TaxID=2316731 RepID=A0A3A8NEH6_9BACT|nr:DUF1579 domain-containing protein [Corallococcus llansteffanensis]RKH42648.1 DUF1579 domain-containing protein [Corallococcus llansteffanensis]